MATLIRLSLGIAVALLAIAGSDAAPELRRLQTRGASTTSYQSVFATDGYGDNMNVLHSRQCLPDDFDWTAQNHANIAARAADCTAKVDAGNLGAACDGVSASSLYYICLANSAGEIDAAATSFDISAFQQNIVGYSSDSGWSQSEEELCEACKRDADIDLTPRQQAVFMYACMQRSTSSACGQHQDDEQRLDADGKVRRARFLSGNCPMSPSQVLDAFGLVTGRTWSECSQGVYTGDDYDAEVSRVACLLQDFKTAAGNVDFPSLESAITNVQGADRSASTVALRHVVDSCGKGRVTVAEDATLAFKEMSSEELVQCWAGWGLFSCSYQESNELAHQFPDTCSV